MKIAFLGLGMMGAPMARRLVDAGHELTVWNRTPEKTRPFEGAATVATSPEAATAGADVAITMVADPEALRAVTLGDHGALAGMGPGSTLIEMSTVGPYTVREVSHSLHSGIEIMDAPVLGSVSQATEGALKVFAGGPEPLFHKHRDLLETFGTAIHVGPLGSGAAMKLVANSVLGVLMTGLGEALALGTAMGLDTRTLMDVLVDSPIGPTASSKRDKIEAGEYPANFKLALASKDLRLVCSAAERVNADLKLGRAARSWFQVAEREGLGDLDYSAVIAAIVGKEASA